MGKENSGGKGPVLGNWVAIENYHGLSNLNNRHPFFTSVQIRSPRFRCQQIEGLASPLLNLLGSHRILGSMEEGQKE